MHEIRLDELEVQEVKLIAEKLSDLFSTYSQNKDQLTGLEKALLPESTSANRNLDYGVGDLLLEFQKDAYQLTRFAKDKYNRLQLHFEYFGKALPEFEDREYNYQVRVAAEISKLMREGVSTFLNSTISTINFIGNIEVKIDSAVEYLHSRYVDHTPKVPQREDMFSERPKKPFEKILFYQDNPLLTDTLVHLTQALPYQKVRKEKGKEIKEISEYSLNNFSEGLEALGDTNILSRFDKPQEYFSKLGSQLETLLQTLDKLYHPVQEITRMSVFQITTEGMQYSIGKEKFSLEELLEKYEELKTQALRKIGRIKGLDFDNLVQDADAFLPKSSKEIEQKKLRTQIFDTLYSTLQELAKKEGSIEERREKAKLSVRKAVDLQYQFNEVSKSHINRKLKQDFEEDNEYYENVQGPIGSLQFERKPAPTIKMEDIVGESFVKLKNHLEEMIYTNQYSNILKLTTPGGKVRSGILLIGPYGCGKTEFARALCGDKRVIGVSVSVANTLTAYMHESVNNVKRMYDGIRDIRTQGKNDKPAMLCLDEFDGWFKRSHSYSDKDMSQIENVFLEVLDGMGDYSGIVTIAMTNKPAEIPKGILRRFRHVELVGELKLEDRANLLQRFLESGLPISGDITKDNYLKWAEKLEDAPGDVVRKVVDEVHELIIPNYLRQNQKTAQLMERTLLERERKKGDLTDKDKAYVKKWISKKINVTHKDVESCLDIVLERPQIAMQIETAKTVYREGRAVLEEMRHSPGMGSR